MYIVPTAPYLPRHLISRYRVPSLRPNYLTKMIFSKDRYLPGNQVSTHSLRYNFDTKVTYHFFTCNYQNKVLSRIFSLDVI